MVNHVVDEDGRTDYARKSEDGNTRKNSKSGITSIRTREWRIIRHAEIWGGRAPTVVVYRRGLPLRWNWNATTASVGVPAYARL